MTCVPHWAGPDQCCFVDFPFCDGKRRTCIRVRRVPVDHLELRQLCQRVQDELGLKLYYRGESYAMLGHRFVQAVLVYKREAISDSQKQEMMDRQQRRCAMCRDLLSRWECHHSPPVAEGGGGLCLLCPMCHAQETERQELKGQTPQHLESQLNPDMMKLFEQIPRPKQLSWGDAAAKARALAQDDLTPIQCMDVRGCRKNALLTRKYLPVGCPTDTPIAVFDEHRNYNVQWRRFAWLWVEAGDTDKNGTRCTTAPTWTRAKRLKC